MTRPEKTLGPSYRLFMTIVSHFHPPQSVQLQMKAPSGDVIPAHGLGQVTQTVLLNNPNKVGLRSVSPWLPHSQ